METISSLAQAEKTLDCRIRSMELELHVLKAQRQAMRDELAKKEIK